MNREGSGLKQQLCYYFTNDDLVICFLNCSFWTYRVTQKFLVFVATRSFLALYSSRWGGGGKCDQSKHPESGQNLVCMHLAHNWLQLAASEHCCAPCQTHDIYSCGAAKQEYPHEKNSSLLALCYPHYLIPSTESLRKPFVLAEWYYQCVAKQDVGASLSPPPRGDVLIFLCL